MKLISSKGRPIFRFTRRNRLGEHSFEATVHSVEDRGDFYYVSYVPLNPMTDGLFGATKIYKEGVTRPPFAAAVERTGRYIPATPPSQPWRPKPGDRGYDLCH